MPQHVAVHEKWESAGFASSRDHALIASNAQGCPTLTDEHIDACRGLTLEPPQGAKFSAPNRVNAGRAALGAPNVQFASLEVDVIPTQGHELAGAQAVAVG